MVLPNPGDISLLELEMKIESGEYLIPRFQREFVWTKEDSASLLDSVLHGYPIGSFIIWKTNERLKNLKKIGAMDLPDPPESGFVNYVLDGQQRITSLYASAKGLKIKRASGQEEDFSEITVLLSANDDERIVYSSAEGLDPNDCISLRDLRGMSLTDIFERFSDNKAYINKIDTYRRNLESYKFATIELGNANLDVATEIFTRLNINGKALTAFEIMCAKMYDEVNGFDLLTKREEQIEAWKAVGYETVPNMTVLQAISVCIQKVCSGKDILSLDKQAFIDEWYAVNTAFSTAIDYFKSAYGVVVSKLLPYDALLVPFVYYFRKHPAHPTGLQKDYLADYFWRCAIGTRFTEGLVSKLAQDVSNVMDVILSGGKPAYDHGLDISFDSIKQKGEFATGSAFVKALLCILAAQKPKRFDNGLDVVIDNAFLSQGNSKNYHHFFPKKYMEKYHRDIDSTIVNHIANITIAPADLNKNVIRAKAPHVYMQSFASQNADITETMSSHLIAYDDEDTFGIQKDDYITFFNQRIKAFQNEIMKRIIVIKSLDIVPQEKSEDTISLPE